MDDSALDSIAGTLSKVLGASSGWLPLLNTRTGAMRLMAPHNVSLGAIWDYASYYHEHDPWLATAMSIQPNTVMRGEDYVRPTDFKRLGLFADYVKPNFGPVMFCLGARIPLGEEVAFIGLHRLEAEGPFPQGADKALQALIPPLRRMLQVRRRFETMEARASDLERSFDRLAYGVVRCDADGRIQYANAVALDMIGRQDGLRGCVGGRIGALERNDSASLARLVDSAARQRSPAGGSLCVRRSGGQPAYRVVVTPLRRRDAESACLLLIDDPACQERTAAARITGLYGYSSEEADLASALVNGIEPDEFALTRGVARETVSHRLRSVFAKTGVRCQLELVATLSSLPATTPDSARR